MSAEVVSPVAMRESVRPRSTKRWPAATFTVSGTCFETPAAPDARAVMVKLPARWKPRMRPVPEMPSSKTLVFGSDAMTCSGLSTLPPYASVTVYS